MTTPRQPDSWRERYIRRADAPMIGTARRGRIHRVDRHSKTGDFDRCPTCGAGRSLLTAPVDGATMRLELVCGSCGTATGI